MYIISSLIIVINFPNFKSAGSNLENETITNKQGKSRVSTYVLTHSTSLLKFLF